jgi:superfamily II DNA or RNA helicase
LKSDPNAKIFVITLTHLVGQFVQDFISYGIDPDIISPWTGETGFVENKIVVAGNVIASSHCVDCKKEIPRLKVAITKAEKMLNSASGADSRTRKKLEEIYDNAVSDLSRCESKLETNIRVMRYFKKVNVLMVDEVHQMKRGNAITDITDFVTTRHTFGYTGTLPESKIDEWTVIGKMGPVRQIVERAKLVENKSIADVCVQFLKINYKEKPEYLKPNEIIGFQDQLRDFQKEAEFLYHSDIRNGLITKIATKFGKNILIIVDRIEHGEMLRDMIKSSVGDSKEVVFISGEMPEEERDEIKRMMEQQDNVVCIAISKVFSTGVNIKNIYAAIFAFVCKAKVSLVQTVGRCVRMKDNKSMAFIFDLHDCLKYSERHHALREKIYNAEGFIMREKEV